MERSGGQDGWGLSVALRGSGPYIELQKKGAPELALGHPFYFRLPEEIKLLSAQELFQGCGFSVGSAHVILRGLEVALIKGAVGLLQGSIHSAHCGENVAANVESLSLLLAANLLHATARNLRSSSEIHYLVTRLANLLR